MPRRSMSSVAGAGLDPGHDPSLLVPRLGRVTRHGKAAHNLNLVHGTAHPDIVGGGADQAVEHNIAGEPEKLVEARVIDLDGVYDPCRPNDRLLLGMGSISEFELGLIRTRMYEAARSKAWRGE